MRWLILLTLISCGQREDYHRCFTKEEALNHCVATRIGETNESTSLAKLFCRPNYTVDVCYQL
jgi:hypothetical protein